MKLYHIRIGLYRKPRGFQVDATAILTVAGSTLADWAVCFPDVKNAVTLMGMAARPAKAFEAARRAAAALGYDFVDLRAGVDGLGCCVRHWAREGLPEELPDIKPNPAFLRSLQERKG